MSLSLHAADPTGHPALDTALSLLELSETPRWHAAP